MSAECSPALGSATGGFCSPSPRRVWARALLGCDADRPCDGAPGPLGVRPDDDGLGDVSAWVALPSVIGAIGPVPLAVTSNLTLSFLRPAGLADLAWDCRVLPAGRRLATMLTDVMRVPDEVRIAHLTITCALPDDARA